VGGAFSSFACPSLGAWEAVWSLMAAPRNSVSMKPAVVVVVDDDDVDDWYNRTCLLLLLLMLMLLLLL